MGGQEVVSVEEAVTRDDTPQGVEVEVLAPADLVSPRTGPMGPELNDLEARVAALAKQEMAMESWLQDIQDGGDPVAPPLAGDASAEDWEVAAADCFFVLVFTLGVFYGKTEEKSK